MTSILSSAPAAAAAKVVLPDCTICLEKCNKSTRKAASCPYCNESVCRACIQTYLLQDQSVDHRCPSCRAAWNEEFLTTTLTGVFRHGPLKAHRGKILLDTEKARLPDFQERARTYITAKQMKPEVRAECMRLYDIFSDHIRKQSELSYKLKKTKDTAERAEIESKITAVNAMIAEAKRARDDYDHNVYWPNYQAVSRLGLLHGAAAAAAKPPAAKKVWRSKCPVATCGGFLGEDYACGLCEAKACKHCLEPISDAHECNPDTVASVRAVQKEARPCPKCAALISKIDGCDQMWCTQCQTAFSWITGNIETTVVHNPHYYQWMRETGQVIPRAEGPAIGGACGEQQIQTWFRNRNLLKHSLFLQIREASHVNYMAQNSERALRQLNDPEHAAQRCVRHLAQELGEAEWKSLIEKEQKEISINRASVQFHTMCAQVMFAILGKVLDIPASTTYDDLIPLLNAIKEEHAQFLNYVSTTARRLRLTYNASHLAFYGDANAAK